MKRDNSTTCWIRLNFHLNLEKANPMKEQPRFNEIEVNKIFSKFEVKEMIRITQYPHVVG